MTLRRSAVLTLLVACFVAISFPTPARAGLAEVYTQAGFASEVAPGDCAQDFITLTPGSLGNNVSFCGSPGSAFAYSAATVDSASGLYAAGGLSTEALNDTILLSFVVSAPNTPVTAVGGNFFSSSDGPLTVGISTDTNPYSGTTPFTLISFADTTGIPYLGFLDVGQPLTYLEVYSDGTGFPTIQNLDVGTAVPEPGTLGLLGSALVGLGLLSRKRIWHS